MIQTQSFFKPNSITHLCIVLYCIYLYQAHGPFILRYIINVIQAKPLDSHKRGGWQCRHNTEQKSITGDSVIYICRKSQKLSEGSNLDAWRLTCDFKHSKSVNNFKTSKWVWTFVDVSLDVFHSRLKTFFSQRKTVVFTQQFVVAKTI